MKCSVVFSILSVSGLATSACAQLEISLKGSTDGGATWSSQISGNPGTVIQMGIFMTGPQDVYGMGGATLRLTAEGDITGTTASFAPGTSTGRVGPFNFGAATNAIFTTASGFRIDAASDAANASTGAGMTFFQRDPASAGAGFSTANPALVFRFDILLGNEGNGMTLTLDQLSRDVATYYSSASSTRPSSAGATLIGASILIPAPASFLLAVIAPVVLRRCR